MVHNAANVPRPNCATLSQKVQERLPLFPEHLIPHIGNNHRPVHLSNAQLVGGVEFANAIDLIPKKLNAIRVVKGKTENVHDASTNGILTGLVDVVHFLKPVIDQDVVEKILANAVPTFNRVSVALELFAGGNLLRHSFGKADNAHLAPQCPQLAHDLCPHRHIGVVSAFLLVRNPCTTRIKQHLMPALSEQILQVVHEVSCALFVFQQKEVVSTAPANHLGRQKTSGRTNQPSRLHLASCLF